MSLTPESRAVLVDLKGRIAGPVFGPSDAEYDAMRAVAAGRIDARPAVIARVANARDVATVVDVARESGLPLAIRSGGHSDAGHGTVDDGIVIDVRDLRDIAIHPIDRAIWAGGGLTGGEVTIAADAKGLAVGFGDTGAVGLGGLVTGGGVGYLVRKYGLTIDSLLGAEIVTADGEVRLIDAEHERDLFWAIRGGGSNFGVVTQFRFRPHELGEVVGGMLLLPATAETVAGFVDAAESAPEELSAIANVMNCPPMPDVPEDVHGKLVILGMLLYAGRGSAADAALAPFRALAKPHVDLVRGIRYPAMFPPEDLGYRPTAVARTMFVDHVDRHVGQTIVDHLDASDASLRAAQIRVLGGAYARVPVDATAYAHRESRIMVYLISLYDGDDDRARRQAWVDEFRTALYQGDDGAYVNFIGDEGDAGVRAAYPDPTRRRLAAIKARYDPTNLFRRNHNIPPVPTAAR